MLDLFQKLIELYVLNWYADLVIRTNPVRLIKDSARLIWLLSPRKNLNTMEASIPSLWKSDVVVYLSEQGLEQLLHISRKFVCPFEASHPLMWNAFVFCELHSMFRERILTSHPNSDPNNVNYYYSILQIDCMHVIQCTLFWYHAHSELDVWMNFTKPGNTLVFFFLIKKKQFE